MCGLLVPMAHTVCAGLEQVNNMAWVQLPGVSNNLCQDQWHACFEINFSLRQDDLTVSFIICDRCCLYLVMTLLYG